MDMDEKQRYILAVDPSKNSTGVVLGKCTAEGLRVEEYGVIHPSSVDRHTRCYSPVTHCIRSALERMAERHGLDTLNTVMAVENIIIGAMTMPLLYHIFQTIMDFAWSHSFNVATYLPLTVKGYCKCLVARPPKGILTKEQVLSVYREAGGGVFEEGSFNDDVLDAYMLASLHYMSGRGWWTAESPETVAERSVPSAKDISPFIEGGCPPMDKEAYARFGKWFTKNVARKTYPFDYESRYIYPFGDCKYMESLLYRGEGLEAVAKATGLTVQYLSRMKGKEDIRCLANSGGIYLY